MKTVIVTWEVTERHMLDLGEELADLVGGDPERHRRLAAAQLKLDETVEAVAHD